ncbi:MAG: amidohydrolase family protein [Candidatus Zipacnadales bacterium]
MDNVRYFDAYCVLGRNIHMPEGQPETVEAILAAMNHYGIHEAIVVDALAKDANPVAGNARLLERIAGEPRLHAAWAGLMPHSRELPPPKDLLTQMQERGVVALFLFYRAFDIRLDDWGVDELLSPMAEARVPLFLCPDAAGGRGNVDQTDWPAVVALCQRFPELPVVVTEHRIYKTQRSAYSALSACPNLHLDLRALWLHRRIEFICREFGAERLIWSSGLPGLVPAVPMMQLAYSEISENELRLIAGENLRRLLSWNPHFAPVGEVSFSEPVDHLHRAARERQDLSTLTVYDCHGHLGSSTPHHVIDDTLDQIVAEMDRFGVRVCCVFSLEGVFSDETFGNVQVAEALKRYPDRFVGFTMVNPNHGERDLLLQLEQGLARGMRGIKLISSYHGYPIEGPLIDVACRFAHEHRQLILNHYWGSAAQVERLCTTYPNACFITGHSTLEYAQVARKVKNLYVCSCPFNNWGQIEAHVAAYGADRILFGSDLTDLPIVWGLAPILHAPISVTDKLKILGGNLQRILRDHEIRPTG